MSSPEVTWDLLSEPHSCSYCEKIIANIPDAINKPEYEGALEYDSFTVVLPNTIDDIFEIAQGGCSLYKWIEDKLLWNQKTGNEKLTSGEHHNEIYFSRDMVHCCHPGAAYTQRCLVAAAGMGSHLTKPSSSSLYSSNR